MTWRAAPIVVRRWRRSSRRRLARHLALRARPSSSAMAHAASRDRSAATEFTFLVGIPTMFAASAYAIYKDLKAPSPEHTAWSMVALGTLVSAVVAFIVVRWLLRFIQSHTFVGFGWYRIVLGLLMVFFALR